MKTLAMESLSKTVRSRILNALVEPVLMTQDGQPVMVLRSLLDDDTADELIAQHPDFAASIERGKKQRTAGQVKTVAELRQKYSMK